MAILWKEIIKILFGGRLDKNNLTNRRPHPMVMHVRCMNCSSDVVKYNAIPIIVENVFIIRKGYFCKKCNDKLNLNLIITYASQNKLQG